MRSIEFKAWLKYKNIMVDVINISFSSGTITYLVDENFDCNVATLDHVILLQYTGIKYKDGAKVLEGDVARHLYTNQIGEVFFCEKNGAWGFRVLTSPVPLMELLYENTCLQKIGTIYENSEFFQMR